MKSCSEKSKIYSKTDLLSGERIDQIGFGGLVLIQAPEEFCYGVDAVILAHFAANLSKEVNRVVDLGTGTGVIPLILSHMIPESKIVGVEVQLGAFERACRNMELNHISHRVNIVHGDVAFPDLLEEAFGSVDMVVSNPPYVKRRGGLQNKLGAKMIARHETTADLAAFIEKASLLLRDKGSFFMVHRPERLVDICTICRQNRLEPKTIRFVSPDAGKAPNILLIHCVKYGGQGLKFMDPLFVYDKAGRYTEEIERIYGRI